MKYLASLLLCFIVATSMAQENYRLVIGTYTSGKSEGIYLYDFNIKTGEATRVSVTKDIANPSYLGVSPDQKYIYAVSERNGGGNAGQVYAYAYNKAKGELTFINKQPSGGDDPCYVSVSRNGKWVIAGNYSSGSLKALRSAGGHLYDENKAILHEGKGIKPERQEKPHVHATYLSPDNKTLYVPDLGIDQVVVYRFDSYSGQLTRKASVSVEPGSGPRHIEIHPNGKFAYVMEELKGNVSVFAIDGKNGTLKPLQTISAAAEGFSGDMGSADIHVSSDGKFVYASNRGNANDIAIFSVDPKKGTLTKVANQPVLGIAPRNFTLDPSENFLLVANMKSDEIVVFSRDKNSGKLTDTGKRISVPTPVCLKWIAK
jgi:6-phosphogluconolactonase